MASCWRPRSPGLRHSGSGGSQGPAYFGNALNPVFDPPRVPQTPHGNRNATLHAEPRSKGHFISPLHDPAGVLHDEAKRHERNAARHVAGIWITAPVLSARPGRWIRRNDATTGVLAFRDHRFCSREPGAQRRLAGRICRSASHSGIPSLTQTNAPRRVPHSVECPWNESGKRRDGGNAGRRRFLRFTGEHRSQ